MSRAPNPEPPPVPDDVLHEARAALYMAAGALYMVDRARLPGAPLVENIVIRAANALSAALGMEQMPWPRSEGDE